MFEPDPLHLVEALGNLGRSRRRTLAVVACEHRDSMAEAGQSAMAEFWSALACLASEVTDAEDQAVRAWATGGVAVIEAE